MTVSFESLFESIKLIAENVVKAIKFDETKFCTIVDDSDKKQGKYLVEEGDIQFEAISESQTFNKGDKVRVSFVMGDINNPKYIIGKAVDINSEDILVDYVSPLDTVVDISSNLMDNFATYYPNDSTTAWSIMANGEIKDKLIATLDLSGSQELQNRSVYETIFMTAEFRSLMSEYRMKQGNYGIRIELFNEAGQRVGGDMIDSSEMFGNPYRFTIYTKQEKKGDIRKAGPISRIDVYLYQNNNFKYYNTTGEELDLNPDDFGEMDNIWVKNITLGFGSEVTSIEDNTLEIYSNEPYIYNSDTQAEEELKRNLRVIWYNKDKNNRYIGFGDAGKSEEENKAGYIKYSLDWYSYSPGNDKEEEGIPVVQDWKYKGSDGLPALGLMKPEENDYQSVPLNGEIREDKFKAILRITERINDYNFIYDEESGESEEDQKEAYNEEDKVENIQYITVESNILTFVNEAILIDTLAADANNGALYIEHGDFSQAGYSFYDEVNVIDKSYEALRERKLYVRFNGLSGKDDQIDGAIVYWYVPNILTMLSFDEENLTDETKGLGYQKLEETHPRHKENYTCYYKILSQFNSTDTGNIDATGGLVSRTFLYKVKDYYSESYKNNTILCEVDKGKITFKAEISFIFSTKGIAGTDYTLVVAPVDKQQAATAGSTFKLGISLYNPSGEIMKIDSEPKLTWEGIYDGWNCTYSEIRDNILIYTITAPALSYGSRLPILKINVTAALDFSTEDEEVIESRKLDLITYYPMSYTNGEYYANSPNFITYRDNNVNPSYQKDPYQLFNNTYTPLNATWEEFYFSYDTLASVEEEKPFLPSLTESNSLLPKNLYISNPTGYLVVWGKTEDSQAIWGQAVKVLKNRYLSTTLNQWNGELVIDNDNNTILTAMVGAGQKNKDNSFSGVVMGEFEKLKDGTYATGLRGYHQGEKSFEFDINGTATLGKSGRGQIKFDGNKSTIQSASYAEKSIGMLLDLDNGIIDLRGSSYNDGLGKWENDGSKANIHIDIKDPYFTITSPNPEKIDTHLIYIGKNKYFLQSENYKKNEEGFELSEPIKLEVTLEEVNSVVEVYVEEYRKAMWEDLVGIITGDGNNRANCIKNYILNPNADKYNNYPTEKANLLKWELTSEEINKIATEYSGSSSDVINGILNTINSRIKEYGQGTKINLQNGIIDSYNLTLLTKYLLLDCKEEADPFFVLKDSDDKILMYSGIKTLDNTDSTIFYEVTENGEQIGNPSNLFLKSPNYNLITENKQDELKRIKHSGTFLDLNNGFFTTDHYYIAGKGILDSGKESYKLILDSKSYADLLITYDEKDKPVIRIAADGQSSIGRFTVKNGVIESPSEQWYNETEEERIKGIWGYYIPSALEKEFNVTNKTSETDRNKIIEKVIWADVIYHYGMNKSSNHDTYQNFYLKNKIKDLFFIPENYQFSTLENLNNNTQELIKIISGTEATLGIDFWQKIKIHQNTHWKYIPNSWFETYIKELINQILYFYFYDYSQESFENFLMKDTNEVLRVVSENLNTNFTDEDKKIAFGKFLNETVDNFHFPQGSIYDEEEREQIIQELNSSTLIQNFIEIEDKSLDNIKSFAYLQVLNGAKYNFTTNEGVLRELSEIDYMIDDYLKNISTREVCEIRYVDEYNSGNITEIKNCYSDSLGRDYAIAIGGKNAKSGYHDTKLDFFPLETHNFKVSNDGRVFIYGYEITEEMIEKLVGENFSWHTGEVTNEGSSYIPTYPINPEPQYKLIFSLSGNDGKYNSGNGKGFWTLPRRSIKVEGSGIRINKTQVQVDLRLTYEILSSSSDSFTKFSQYFTPELENSVNEIKEVKLKGSTPTNWFGKPIIKTVQYIIATEENTIPIPITFRSTDPQDKIDDSFSFTVEKDDYYINVI